MLTRRRARLEPAAAPEWSRQKLLAALSLLAVLAVAVLAGAGLWVWLRLAPAAGPGPASSQGSAAATVAALTDRDDTWTRVTQARRDAAAAAPMRAADPAAAQPAWLSARDPGAIDLPAATGPGPVGIPTGFPHTPEGALAQLVAIDTDVLNTATLDHARQVIAGWAAPGGPSGESWSAVKALAGFHSAAGLSGGPSPGLSMRATPMMGLVKATDGPDWTVVCVDFEVDATLARTARVAAADCQRMAWDGDRWIIGPGAEPALAPSIWPGTDAAIDAGYRNLRHG
jgi:nitrate reductase NapE component